ncbi:MAG: glycosyltransferase family 4 protein [Microbacteriaceae bacterium]
MTFFFDARFIRLDHHDGISRFTANLCSEVSRIIPTTAIVSHPQQLRFLPEGIAHVIESPVDSFREIGFARRMNRRGATVVFSPMQTTGSLGKRFKLILTIHDLIYYQHRQPPKRFSLLVRLLWRLYHLTFVPARWILAKADAVVTVSKATAALMKRHRLYRGGITVVPNSVEANFLSSGENHNRDKNLVYMGTYMGYKNVETLIQAAGLLPDWTLHLVGSIESSRKQDLSRMIHSTGANVVFHGPLSDAEYIDLLDRSRLFVSASQAEGFGIPVLEAMSRGTGCVLSDIPAFREVAGGAALYFEALDHEDCAEKILLAEESLGILQTMGKTQLQQFSWQKSAQELSDLVKSI